MFSRMSKQVLVLLVGLFVMVEAIAVSSDSRYVEEFQSSVVVSERDKKIVVVFLRNNLKENIKNDHVASGDIYYIQVRPLAPVLKYVWKVEGDQISGWMIYKPEASNLDAIETGSEVLCSA